MRVAMFVGTGEPLEIEDVEPAAPGPRDVVVELGASGVCHSDLSNLCDTEFEVMMAQRGTRADQSPYMTMTGLGTFAEAMTVSETSIVKINTDLPFEQLALIGCGVTTGV